MLQERVLSAALVLSLAVACSKAPPPPPPPEATPTGRRSQPIDFNAPLNTSLPDQARVKLDLAAAVRDRAKRPVEGMLTDSLEELVLKLNYPADLCYDSASGVVKSSSYPTF
jgi:hypothetical protein